MAENPPDDVMYFGENDDDDDDDSDNNEEERDSPPEDMDNPVRCVKLELEPNIAAYKSKKELLRATECVPCTSSLVENVTMNYIIAKQIISNLPWQEKMLCQHVCTTWHSAVQALKKEQIAPQDFVVNLHLPNFVNNGTTFMQSGVFYTEPLVVMTFANSLGVNFVSNCAAIEPSPCKEPCKKKHNLLDLVNHKTNAPNNRMHTIKANYMSYVPLPHSITYKHTINHLKNRPFIGGIFIPMIPGVQFHAIHLKSHEESIDYEFYNAVEYIARDRIFKGVLVYVTERYVLHTVEDIVFLNYFKEKQPDIPYALGGCIIEDTVFDGSDINLVVEGVNDGTGFISDNLLSIALFTVPKEPTNREHNFDMFSLILESSDWSKPKIQQSINEFAKKVPKFEHSIAVKLSCVGRDQKHKLEQELFRAAFPNTRIIGCYGNGELGLNHPAKPPSDSIPNAAKRHKHDPGPQYGIMYSYSTVFVYIGWGKILLSPVKVSSSH